MMMYSVALYMYGGKNDAISLIAYRRYRMFFANWGAVVKMRR
jgi:hypothetical protein